MGYSNSSLVDCTVKSPNHSGTRTHKIDRITPHCVVGQLTAEAIGGCFPKGREASCNYGIGKDGRVCLIVDEANRSWCSSSNANDQRAITIECASDNAAPYAFNDAVYNKLVKLCIDICKRNGLTKVLWIEDKNKSLVYSPKSGECVLTVHRWFANKSCPGDWLYSRMGQLAEAINKGLGSSIATLPTSVKPTAAVKAGDKVKIAAGATYYGGKAVPSWVTAKQWIVKECAGDRAVIDKSVDGANAICSPINTKYLTIVSTTVTEPKSAAFEPYLVKVTTDELNIRKGAGTNYGTNRSIKDKGVYTIVEEKNGQGANKWGKLKSGAGWIALDYTERV